MIENVKRIRNPLTIIGIFSALCEVGGTIVLPFVLDQNQIYYMWFLILFPTILVVGFFLTLNFNSKVLYALSDFRDEENFLKYLQPISKKFVIEKVKAEFEESKKAIPDDDNLIPDIRTIKKQKPHASHDLTQQASPERLFFIEEMLIDRLRHEFKTELTREFEVAIGGHIFRLDAVAIRGKRATLVEVKVLLTNHLNNWYTQ